MYCAVTWDAANAKMLAIIEARISKVAQSYYIDVFEGLM